MPSSPSTARPAASPYIISGRADLALIFGAPFIILCLLAPIARWTSPEAIAYFILGALALAHHLPGFLRVYGDRTLFRQYRFRLLFFPPAIFALTYALAWHNLGTAVMVLLAWGVWHVMMQVFGFARIYGAKRGESGNLVSRLDWLLCFCGFLAVVLWSPPVTAKFRNTATGLGLGDANILFGSGIREVFLGVCLAVGVFYVGYTVWRWRRGLPVAPLKLAFLATSLTLVSTSWVFWAGLPLLGLAIFELFHDVQYVAIVWAANRGWSERGDGGRLLKALFRPSAKGIVAYVGIVLAYGCVVYLRPHAPVHAIKVGLIAFVQTSTLLHYYFDGFAWKVRQSKTREDLGIEGGSRPALGLLTHPAWGEAKQVALVAAPFVVLMLL